MRERRSNSAQPSTSRPEPRVNSPFGAIGTALLLLVLGATAGYALAMSRTTGMEEELAQTKIELSALSIAHDTLQERNWLLFEENERLIVESGQASTESSVTTGVADPESGAYSDGVYVVGRDIEPGTYDGRVTGEFGYWARLKSTSGMVSSIVTNDLVRGPFVMDVNPNDTAIELRGVTITPAE